MIVKHFGCKAMHNKALYECIIHSLKNTDCIPIVTSVIYQEQRKLPPALRRAFLAVKITEQIPVM